jgi:hypothetical protein
MIEACLIKLPKPPFFALSSIDQTRQSALRTSLVVRGWLNSSCCHLPLIANGLVTGRFHQMLRMLCRKFTVGFPPTLSNAAIARYMIVSVRFGLGPVIRRVEHESQQRADTSSNALRLTNLPAI